MCFDDKQYSIFNGKKLRLEIFGASHAAEIGVKASGMEGVEVDLQALKNFMARRRAKNAAYSTKRLEQDEVIFKQGFDGEKIDGEFNAVIKNSQQNSKDYSNLIKTPRPSHADYVGWSKYGEKFDYRGGGKFSGRLTAPMCIAGGILKNHLEKSGVKINAYIAQIGSVKGKSYKDCAADISEFSFEDEFFPLLDNSVKKDMAAEIESAAAHLDSVGGIIECVITGVPVGTGEYMFDSLEGVISQLAFAVPAVKGIEFGSGFDLATMHGSQANDSFYFDNQTVKTLTNHNGGINGGMANGMPITFRVVVKPTPSISKEQNTVDLVNKTNAVLKIEGRHDACIVPRAVPVIEAIAAIAIFDNI